MQHEAWREQVFFRFQKFGIWSGIGFFVLFGISCWNLAGFVPPPSPTLTGSELLETYRNNLFGVRLSMITAFIAAILLVPWSAALSIELARIEGRLPMMSLVAFGAGIANAVAFYLPFVFWSAGVYRMDRSPELVLLISDMAWLEFVMLFAPYITQMLAVAAVGFSDRSATPSFPRWFCFLSIWTAILAVPGGFVIFFKTGPFTWNGAFGFWIPVAAFCVYYSALIPLMFKALRRHRNAAWKNAA